MSTIIKTGICSYGMSGKIFHAPFIESHPGYELTAIVERHKNESKERYPNAKIYRSIEEMLSDESIQLVIVNTPVQLHLQHAKAALQAGKHIVVEKPFTVTPEEAEELQALADEKGLLLSVYQNRRYDGDFRAVKEVLDQQWLGDIKEAEFRYDRYRIEPSGKLHKEGNIAGSGTLHDLGAHLIDQALQFFGMPTALFADIRILRPGMESNDYFEILLYYPSLRVRLKSTIIARESYYAYILHGMKGSFLQQRSDRQEELLAAGAVPTVESWCPPTDTPDGLLHTSMPDGTLVRNETLSTPGNYMGYYDDVLAALQQKANNPVPAADAIKTMRIIDAALQSAAEQKVILL